MLKDLAELDCGLYILKPKLFPPLLLALHTPPPSTLRNNSYPGPPPATPKLPSRRALLEGGNRGIPRNSTRPLKPREYDYDEDDEKENQGPGQEKPPAKEEEEEEEEEERPNRDLHHLLQKWGADIDKLKDKVCRDLDSYNQKLGIRL
uniref:E4 protein n=1 Tax=Human papillomavirus TaxID=10566 RepID=Q84290_9PAPI|nr:E4 protein - human papillomavirus type 4 [Human papillomavirus 4]AAA47015.1 E4 [Human papillomavirus]